jgi:hypothetical protein
MDQQLTDGARPDRSPVTYSDLLREHGREVAGLVLEKGRHYTAESGEPFWLSGELAELLDLAGFEPREDSL